MLLKKLVIMIQIIFLKSLEKQLTIHLLNIGGFLQDEIEIKIKVKISNSILFDIFNFNTDTAYNSFWIYLYKNVFNDTRKYTCIY